MLKGIWKLLCVILLSFMVVGCAATTQKEEQAAVNVKWPFYKVEKNGNHLYILGTVHIGEKGMYPFPSKIKEAMKSSKYLVTEIDMNNVMSRESQEQLLNAPKLGDNKKLDSLLSPEAKTHLNEVVQDYGIPYESLQDYRPWYVSNSLSLAALEGSGFDATLGVDNQLVQLGKELNLENKSLESIAMQFEFLQKAYPDEDADQLIKELPKKEAAKEQFIKLMEAYKKGDVQKEFKKQSNEKIDEYLVKERNTMWVPQLEAFIISGDVHFVAVGAGHLEGENGVLTLLKKKGYTITK
ncbi:TraB/GumN family protein [Bacillus sp. S13(2024)]|uniref:TraB/GumN family protein n=1 Tax=unclassified Bacillus (in: firmicutes) TaxID=185979 RepID=UPI003D23B0AF